MLLLASHFLHACLLTHANASRAYRTIPAQHAALRAANALIFTAAHCMSSDSPPLDAEPQPSEHVDGSAAPSHVASLHTIDLDDLPLAGASPAPMAGCSAGDAIIEFNSAA